MQLKVVERKMGREGALGQCHHSTGLVEVDPRQAAKEYLDTLCHEVSHQLLPYHSEDFIKKCGTTLTAVLWRAGYRKVVLK